MRTTRPASDTNRSALHEEAQTVRHELQQRLEDSDLPRIDQESVRNELATLRRVQRRAAENISWSASQMLRGQLSDAAHRARSILA